MRIGKQADRDEMLSHLFFRLLPVQVGIVAMESVNAIIDGIAAARFIDPATVGVIGLYYSVLRILEAVGGLLLGGTAVLCGRYLGAGKLVQTRGVCTLSLTIAFLTGAVLTAASFLAPDGVAALLGADEGLHHPLTLYVKGYAVGILPQLLAQQFASFLLLERQDRRGRAGILVMIASNALLDFLLVVVWKTGVYGLALATSLSNWAYFFIVAGYYLTDRAQLKPSLKLIAWKELPELLKTGFPNALLVGCLAGRSLVLNRLLLGCAGEDGLSALSAFNMVCGLILAAVIGTGSVVRMLSSVFLGEENREGLRALTRIVLTRVTALILLLTAAVILAAPLIASIFFPDRTGSVFLLTKQLTVIYGCCIPLAFLCVAYNSYAQAAGHRVFVNLVSVSDGFLGVVLPALLLAPALGALGVWLSFPAGMSITGTLTLLYIVFRSRGWPHGTDEWLLLPPDFGTGERLVLVLRRTEELPRTSEQVEAFCAARGLPPRISMQAGLCLEEIAGNIIRHGFTADRKSHSIELRVVPLPGSVLLRIKDDCIPFNPKEWYEMTASDDPLAGIGIRLVFRLAEEVNYQNLLGLNVLTVRLKDSN